MKSIVIQVSVLLLTLVLTGPASAQHSTVTWCAFDMGFEAPERGNTVILSAVGQAFVGVSRTSSTRVTSGFLVDTMASGTVVGVSGPPELPASYLLEQNYPNPFNPSTTIHFELPQPSRVTLKVYNVLGQEVMTVVNEELAAGRFDVRIDAAALASGAYFYRIHAEGTGIAAGTPGHSNGFVQTRKFLLVR